MGPSSRRGELLRTVGMIGLALCLASAPSIRASGDTKTARGTVNIALANATGIVLLTDSVQSSQGADGWHFVQPVQKLFRIDDKTVCSIAGFAAERGLTPAQLDTEVSGIIASVKDELSHQDVPQLDAKLRAIGFLVGFYIDVIANRREVVVGPSTASQTYKFEIIVAGYDADGKPKIEKLVLTPVVLEGSNAHRYWSHTTSMGAAQVGNKLVSVLGGIQDVSNEVPNNPQHFSDSEVVRRYILAKNHDGGESLTLDDMAELASYMAAQTARMTPAVGGPDQVAILTGGRIRKFDQPNPNPRDL